MKKNKRALRTPVVVALVALLAALLLAGPQVSFAQPTVQPNAAHLHPLRMKTAIIGGVDLGNLTDYLFFFGDGRTDANWQGATKGFVGDVAVNGVVASERTSGGVPYAGTIYTNDSTLGAWQGIVDQNAGQASASTGQTARLAGLAADLTNAFAQINALPATSGYTSVSSTSLNGLNTQDTVCQTLVINITSGLGFSSKINITGDACDVFVLRWDSDGNPNNGYQGQVKPQSGGAVVPLGGLTPSNFINVAGDINSSGGGSNPAAPYPQGPRFNDGQGALCTGCANFNGGGFFTGYWLTTGDPVTGQTQPLSNGIFVGGWYSLTSKFSMTSGTSGVYVSPNPPSGPSQDFGDAPTAAQSGFASSYPTTLAANGARHAATGPTLGAARDVEGDGQPNLNATGDDLNGTPDDEDGVAIPTLTQGQAAALTVNASAPAKLDAWIDWNRDGDWADADEQIATTLPVVAGNNTVNVNVPAGASSGTSYARFRLSTAGGLAVTGAAADGEVEDHSLTIQTAGTDIEIIKTASPDPVVLGENLTYTLVVTNRGSLSATGVRVQDTLPSEVSFVSVNTSQGTCSQASGLVTCNLGTIGSGASATITIVVTVNSMTEQGTLWGKNTSGEVVVTSAEAGAPTAPEASPPIVDLGAASQFAIVGRFVQLHNADVYGNAAIGANGSCSPPPSYNLDLQSPGILHGIAYKETAATVTTTPSNVLGGIVNADALVAQAFTDAMNAYNTAIALTPDQTITGNVSGVTITASHGGQYVIRITGNVNGSLILNPAPGTVTKFIVIVEGTITLGGSDTVGWADATGSKNVLVVVKGSGTQLTSHIGNAVYGTMLAPFRGATFHGFAGAMISGCEFVKFQSDAQINFVGYETNDWGDAPNSYGTLYANNGPRHVLVPGLTLGTTIDTENDGLPTVNVNGDDNDGTPDDEDAVGTLSFAAGSSPSVAVAVTNNYRTGNPLAGQQAFMRCWMDLNGNGSFADAGEDSSLVTIPASSGTGNYSVHFGALTATGTTYLRCRLSLTAADLANATGAATSGEVEDHLVTVQTAPICPPGEIYNAATVTSNEPDPALSNNSDDVCTPVINTSQAIGDFVWYDSNHDGIENVGEPGIPNVTIQLRRDSNGNNTLDPGDEYYADTATDADGGYLFTDLPPGTYFVDVTDTNNVLAGLTHIVANQSKPDPTAAIVLTAGQVYKDADFGYYQQPDSGNAIIGDTVWYDDNGDGIQQPNEQGIPDIEVCATPADGGTLICTTTDSNGHYLIEVPAGSYSVAPTNPPSGYTATTLVPHPVSVTVNEQYLNADFGYNDNPAQPQLGTIGDLVFRDANKDGVCNSGDSPLPGVSVDLIRDSDGSGTWDMGEPIIATVTTTPGAACVADNYLFTGVPAGNYLVHVSDTNAVLFDYTKSPLGAAGVNNNNQADPYAINLATGGANLTADFGYYPADHTNIGVIGNQVWTEKDYNGLYDANATDVGQAGVTVQLLKNGTVIATTTTGASGDYAFVSLPGGTYQVRVADSFGVLAGYVVTVLGPNPGQDNNNQAQPYQVVLPTGGYNLTADFGYIKLGAIGDFVWYDKNRDGIENVGEPGIPNVTVALYRDTDGNGVLSGGDTLVSTRTTDADGGYLFNNLPPATYFVDVTDTNNVLAGLTHLVANQSQPDPTGAIVLGAGRVYKDADFGYVQVPTTGKAEIGDTVWYDDNGDGVQQPGEPGIPGVQVCATPVAGGAPLCDVTDSNGHYLIEVPPGSYSVAPTNPPPGYTATTPVPHVPAVVLAGDQYLKADFGYDDTGNNFLGAIGNLVFLDANKDGVYNTGDTPFPGVSVDLIRDSNSNGVWDAGEPIIATATTASTVDANTGNYLFSGLTTGRYLVHVSDTNGVLYGYTKSPLGATGVNNNNQADPYAVNLPTGADNLTADFGYFLTDRPMGAIGNQVWIETDNNGLFAENSGDYGQHGVTVQLRQGGVVIATTTTGASGDYVFVGLQAGNYDVRVSDALGVLTGYAPTVIGPNPGQDNNNQGQPYAVALAQGQFNPTADFGYFPGPDILKDSTIGNLVWVDRDANGLYTGGEPGIGNVTIQLWYDSNRNCARDQFDFLVDTKLTNSSIALGGNYRFVGEFPAGNYLVIVTDTNQVLTTYTKSTGPNPGQDNNSQALPYCIQNFNPSGLGGTNLTADFGYWQPVTVGDFTWVDTNGNNVYDPGIEPPLSGVIVQVKNSSGVVVATVTTGPTGGFPAGTYLVNGLPPGQYTATVIPQPNGYLPAGPTTLTSVMLYSGQSDLTLDFPFISPTSVLVTNFTANQQSSGYVNLAWTTLAEGANEGFHVWRATSADGVYQRMTTTPIASQASGGAGASYTWVDETALRGKVYFYRLETLPANQVIGPVASRLWGTQLFIPWLHR